MARRRYGQAGTPPGGADPPNPGRELAPASALSGRSRRSDHRRDRAAVWCRPRHKGPPDPQVSAGQVHLVGDAQIPFTNDHRECHQLEFAFTFAADLLQPPEWTIVAAIP